MLSVGVSHAIRQLWLLLTDVWYWFIRSFTERARFSWKVAMSSMKRRSFFLLETLKHDFFKHDFSKQSFLPLSTTKKNSPSIRQASGYMNTTIVYCTFMTNCEQIPNTVVEVRSVIFYDSFSVLLATTIMFPTIFCDYNFGRFWLMCDGCINILDIQTICTRTGAVTVICGANARKLVDIVWGWTWTTVRRFVVWFLVGRLFVQFV